MTARDRCVYWALMLLGLSTTAAFYWWWLRPEHLPQNFSGRGHLIDVAVYGCLTLALSHRVFMDLYCWVVARRIEPFRPAPDPEPGLKVAFITTFVPGSEGLDLLQRTLPAMVRADYPHDVWLLDEGDDEEARALCERLGVHYFTRHGNPDYQQITGPFTRRTKGGNHNAWYDAHGETYDVVAQIDTDFLPRKDFLTQTLGHFRDERVGWVTTPQIYGNTHTFVARGSAEQQLTFYGPVLRGLSARGMANMLGANHVVRVRALEGIHYYAGHVTEDLLTGMRLHADGWRSVYVPLPLAVGEGPSTWKAYFDQQHRWAFGCVQILLNHSRRLTRAMPRTWRLLYVALQQGYFSGVAALLGLALLVAYFLGGLEISRVPFLEMLVWWTPFFLVRHVVRVWLQKFNVRPEVERGLHLSGSLIAIAAMPVYVLAVVRVLRGKDLVFKVTPKGRTATRRPNARSVRRLFAPHGVVAGLALVCLVTSVLTGRQSGPLVAWAAVNLTVFGLLWLAPDKLAGLEFDRRHSPGLFPVLHQVNAATVSRLEAGAPVLAAAAEAEDGRRSGPAGTLGSLLPHQRRRRTSEVDVAEYFQDR